MMWCEVEKEQVLVDDVPNEPMEIGVDKGTRHLHAL